jgi:hypothetical protein
MSFCLSSRSEAEGSASVLAVACPDRAIGELMPAFSFWTDSKTLSRTTRIVISTKEAHFAAAVEKSAVSFCRCPCFCPCHRRLRFIRTIHRPESGATRKEIKPNPAHTTLVLPPRPQEGMSPFSNPADDYSRRPKPPKGDSPNGPRSGSCIGISRYDHRARTSCHAL